MNGDLLPAGLGQAPSVDAARPVDAAAAPAARPDAAPVFDVRIEHEVGGAPRRFALDVAFRTAARQVVITGPSGAGKTLTLQAVAGLLTPRAGRIAVGGATVLDTGAATHLPARERRFGVVFQDYALFPHLTVRENIAFGLARGWRNPGAALANDARVEALLARLALDAVAHQRPHELSGGQRQRTALARALATEPRALLLDEPFAALDPALRERLRDDLDALLRERALPLLLITHDPADRERFGHCALTVESGRVAREDALG